MSRRVKKYLKRESAFRGDSRLEKLAWLNGSCKFGLCGEEAACIPGPNATHKCVCPSDLSAPTPDGKLCLTRKTGNSVRKHYLPQHCNPDIDTTGAYVELLSSLCRDMYNYVSEVPLTPRPIVNITINGGNISPPRSTSMRKEPENVGANNNFTEPAGFFITGLLCLLMVFVILIGLAYWWKGNYIFRCLFKTKRRKNDTNPSPLSLSKGLLGNYVPNPQYVAEDVLPVPIISRDTLIFVQEIGEGCFGKVFKGELKKEDGTSETVAIKVLKETASKQAEEDFMREVEIMSAFRHENILSLLGIVLKEATARPWMVFEFMIHGDLAEVLRSNSRQFWNPVPGLKPLTKDSLLKIALQIAGGMKYLASQRFVHNDLACRNCLVGSELRVKIADFGMSRDVYTCDYYRIGGSKPVPLRWMSPESVMYRRFTLESDVWSYGVVLWEIYSLGKQPYYGLNNEEVVKMILQGIMLIPPEGCPPFICDLMRGCWKTEPKDRIKFPDIYDHLKKVWKEREAERSLTISPLPSPPTMKDSSPDVSEISFPRPPIFPVSPCRTESTELLDGDNYLAPQTENVNEYLEPIPN